MTVIGQLSQDSGQYVYSDPARGLRVHGAHPEWVLQAAAEVVALIERAEADRQVQEAEARHKMGEVGMIDVDAAMMDVKERFEYTAQCAISMGRLSYNWTDMSGGVHGSGDPAKNALTRMTDLSLMRNGSFLQNEPGVHMPPLAD